MTNTTRERWRAAGRCLDCGKIAAFGSIYCQRHKDARAEARRERKTCKFSKGDQVRVWRWYATPEGNPPNIARLPHAKIVGTVAGLPQEAQPFYAVDFPPPFGRLQVQEKEMVLIE